MTSNKLCYVCQKYLYRITTKVGCDLLKLNEKIIYNLTLHTPPHHSTPRQYSRLHIQNEKNKENTKTDVSDKVLETENNCNVNRNISLEVED